MSKKSSKSLTIRNSTAEFLIFSSQAGEDSIEVRYQDETIWLTQKLMAELFEVDVRTISEHLKNIFASGELDQESVIRKFRTTAADGKNYNTQFYNLDAIISVGYRVNSKRATQFRQWATQVLREFAIKGYVLDKQRLENGAFLGEDYFERLLEEIREIRLSERRVLPKDHRHLCHQHGLQPGRADHPRVFRQSAKQAALCYSRPHCGGIDPTAGRWAQEKHGIDQLGKQSRWQNLEV